VAEEIRSDEYKFFPDELRWYCFTLSEYMGKNMNQAWKKIEDQVREDPVKAVLVAFASGFFLCLLPLGKLLGVAVRLTFLLVKPALFVFGIIKILEYAGVDVGCGTE
jgi:hypothetical protein